PRWADRNGSQLEVARGLAGVAAQAGAETNRTEDIYLAGALHTEDGGRIVDDRQLHVLDFEQWSSGRRGAILEENDALLYDNGGQRRGRIAGGDGGAGQVEGAV